VEEHPQLPAILIELFGGIGKNLKSCLGRVVEVVFVSTMKVYLRRKGKKKTRRPEGDSSFIDFS
jgi:hypothetical protein